MYSLFKELVELNPDAKLGITPTDCSILYSSIPGNELELPEEYYYCESYGITNRQKFVGSIFVSVEVCDLTDGMEKYIQIINNPKSNKSIKKMVKTIFSSFKEE